MSITQSQLALLNITYRGAPFGPSVPVPTAISAGSAFFMVDFGVAYAGLATVGYTQYAVDGVTTIARTTTGVEDFGQGCYGVSVALDSLTAVIKWDTGGGSPVYSHQSILQDLLAQSYLDAAISTRLATAGYTAPPSATDNADAVLLRNWASILSAVPDRSALNALRWLRNKWAITGGVLTVTKEDDVTAAWTAVMTSDAAADNITGGDPA